MIDDGQSIRFAAYPEDLELDAPWNDSRVVYWQHASDPIVWWSFDLLLNKPDWLAEPLGRDVDPGMTWIPFVTFWQVTLDMVFSADVPPGHGAQLRCRGRRTCGRGSCTPTTGLSRTPTRFAAL